MAVSSPIRAAMPVDEPPRIGYFCGEWLERESMTIPVDDLGFRQGVTAVERLRTYGGQVFQCDAHLDRWDATLELLRIRGLGSRGEIDELIAELMRRNRHFVESEGDVGITMFATPGNNTVGRATFGVHLNRIEHRLVEQRRRRGQPLVVTDVVQPPPAAWPRSIKVRCRLHFYLADQSARDRSPQAAGVLRDTDGSITETSIANVAVVCSGEIVSPPADRVLGGITQQVVEKLAGSIPIRWRKRPITAATLREADEVLLMGTDTGLWFANTVDDEPIGDRGPGEIYQSLRDRFDRYVGAKSGTSTEFPSRRNHERKGTP